MSKTGTSEELAEASNNALMSEAASVQLRESTTDCLKRQDMHKYLVGKMLEDRTTPTPEEDKGNPSPEEVSEAGGGAAAARPRGGDPSDGWYQEASPEGDPDLGRLLSQGGGEPLLEHVLQYLRLDGNLQMIAPQALREKLKSHIKDEHDPLLDKPYLQHTIDIMEKISDFHDDYVVEVPNSQYLTFVELRHGRALVGGADHTSFGPKLLGGGAPTPRPRSAPKYRAIRFIGRLDRFVRGMVCQNPLLPHGPQPLCLDLSSGRSSYASSASLLSLLS